MIKGLLIRCGAAILLMYHGYVVYTTTGYDDFLPVRIMYIGTVIFHAYHVWQYRQYMKQTRMNERRNPSKPEAPRDWPVDY